MTLLHDLVNLVILPTMLIAFAAYLSHQVRMSVKSIDIRIFKFTVGPGTILHELSHLLMAICFGMQINHIQLWNGRTQGDFGHVSFSYRKDSLYSRTGLFFVGLAPLFSLVLLNYYVLTVGYLPGYTCSGFDFLAPQTILSQLNIVSLHLLASRHDISAELIMALVLVYLVFLPHLVPSPSDLKITCNGILPLALLVTVSVALIVLIGYKQSLLEILYGIQGWFILAILPVVMVSLGLVACSHLYLMIKR